MVSRNANAKDPHIIPFARTHMDILVLHSSLLSSLSTLLSPSSVLLLTFSPDLLSFARKTSPAAPSPIFFASLKMAFGSSLLRKSPRIVAKEKGENENETRNEGKGETKVQEKMNEQNQREKRERRQKMV